MPRPYGLRWHKESHDRVMTKQNDSNRAGAIFDASPLLRLGDNTTEAFKSFGRYSGSFGHAKTRPGGIWRDGFEELNWGAPYDRLLPLGERPTQFRQGDILQLSDPLSGHSEFLTDFFESFRFAAVQPESLENNLSLAVVQHLQKLAKFVAHVLVSEQLERRLRIFITDDLAKFG